MKCKVYDCDGYRIHAIKINKYRTTTMSINFRKELKKEDLSTYAILSKLITESSKKYPKKREITVELERLYSSFIFACSNIEGNTLNFEVTYDFLNPKYCEEGYLEEVLKFPFELINNPNVKDGKFDLDSYNICVNNFKAMIEEEKEYAGSYAMKRALENMDINSPSSYSSIGYLEDLDKISPSTLVKSYKRLFTDFIIDIYIAGDVDMDQVVSYIKKYFTVKKNNNSYGSLFIENKERKEVKEVIEHGDYEQASFVMLYNLKNLNKRERDIVLPIFNYIFGGNDLTSKLYTNVREKNSLCYNIGSYINKYSSLLVVKAGIDEKNKDKCVKLVNQCIKDMVNGKFTDDDLLSSKKARINQVKMREDSTWALINIQIANDLDNLLSGNKLINEYKSVTRKEVIEVAKKIKINLVYMLCKEGSNGTN